jgi:hypothetical protein
MHQPTRGFGACLFLLPERDSGQQHEQRHSANRNRRCLADKEVFWGGASHNHAKWKPSFLAYVLTIMAFGGVLVAALLSLSVRRLVPIWESALWSRSCGPEQVLCQLHNAAKFDLGIQTNGEKTHIPGADG